MSEFTFRERVLQIYDAISPGDHDDYGYDDPSWARVAPRLFALFLLWLVTVAVPTYFFYAERIKDDPTDWDVHVSPDGAFGECHAPYSLNEVWVLAVRGNVKHSADRTMLLARAPCTDSAWFVSNADVARLPKKLRHEARPLFLEVRRIPAQLCPEVRCPGEVSQVEIGTRESEPTEVPFDWFPP